MSKVYSTQDYLRIELVYEEELPDTVASVKIKYIDPNSTEGEWEAEHDALNQIIYYDVPAGEPLEVSGKWTVWSFVTMDDGRVLPGSPCTISIYEEGLGSSSSCHAGNCL